MITLFILVLVLGVVAYLIENFVPMSPPFKIVLRVIMVLIIVLYILNLIGLGPTLRLN